MTSYDYLFFISSCFPKGPIEAKDGLAYDLFFRLSDDEKQKAIDLLMNKLGGFLDGEQISERVIEAVGILKLQDAASILQELLKSDVTLGQYFVQAEIGLALHRIRVYPEGIDLAAKALEHPHDSTSWWEFVGTNYLYVYAQEYQRAVRYLVKYLDSSNHDLARSATGCLRRLFKDYPLIAKDLEIIQESLVRNNEQKPAYISKRRKSIARTTVMILDEISSNSRWK